MRLRPGAAGRIGSIGLAISAAGVLGGGPLALGGAPGPATLTQAFSFTPTVSGVYVAPLTFSSTGTALPAGLSLNTSTGAITGTPTSAATVSGINIHVVDSTGTPQTADLTFAIVTSAALTISGSPGAATVGVSYSFTPTSTGGRGTKAYALAGTLPSPLAFNTSTGAITGTPTSASTTTGLNITVTDADGRTASLGAFSLIITVASLTSTSPGAMFMRDAMLQSTSALAVTNSNLVTLVFSIRGDMFNGYVDGQSFGGQVIMQSDPNTTAEVTGGTAPGVAIAFENSGIAQWNFNNSTGGTVGLDDIKFEFTSPYTGWYTPDVWNTYMITWNSGTGDWACFWGDGSTSDMVDLRAAGVVTAASLPTNCKTDWANTNGLMLAASTWAGGPGAIGAMADVYLGVGECLSNGSGTVTTTNTRKFYASGKAQDLSGGNPTGRAPEVLLVGDSTGMLTNIGTCGTNFLNKPSLYMKARAIHDGTTGHENQRVLKNTWGPGQSEPTTPHLRWLQEGGSLGSVTASTQFLPPFDKKVALGDVLVFAAAMVDNNGAYNHNIQLPALLKTAAGANQPNAWASATGGSVWPGSDYAAFNVGTKVVDAADVRMFESAAGRDSTLLTTSTTSITFASGALPNSGSAFNTTVAAGKGFVPGDFVEVWDSSTAPTTRQNSFTALVNTYSGTTLNITPLTSFGSKTAGTAWTINLAGYRWSWSMSGSGAGAQLRNGQAVMACYRGVSAVGAVNKTASTSWAAPGTISTGGVTTTVASSLVLSLFIAGDCYAMMTPHSGSAYTERYKTLMHDSGEASASILSLCDEVKTTAGAYAAQSMDLKKADDGVSTFNGWVCGVNIELQP